MKIAAIVGDTFRECRGKKILISYFIVSTIGILGILVIFNIDIAGNKVAMSSLFFKGEESASIGELNKFIIRLEAFFAMALFSLGLFMSVFATADLMPGMMTKGRLDLYMARPISRPQLLFGKYLGAVAVVTVNILYAIAGLWLVIGVKTGIWNPSFLYAGLSIVFMFMVLYTFALLTGIFFKSAAVTIIALYAMITLNPFLAQRKEIFLLVNNRAVERTADILYWILPKYFEISLITRDLVAGNAVPSWTPVLNSLLIGLIVLNISFYLFSRKNC